LTVKLHSRYKSEVVRSGSDDADSREQRNWLWFKICCVGLRIVMVH